MILSLLLAGMGTAATAQNINLPIIQTKYTADLLLKRRFSLPDG